MLAEVSESNKRIKRMVRLVVLGIVIALASCDGGCYNVDEVEYNGHEYVIFSAPTKYGFSAVHSQDCKCLTNNKSLEQ